jgi:hypothetical protein
VSYVVEVYENAGPDKSRVLVEDTIVRERADIAPIIDTLASGEWAEVIAPDGTVETIECPR